MTNSNNINSQDRMYFSPIGYIQTSMTEKFYAPHQPNHARNSEDSYEKNDEILIKKTSYTGYIELLKHNNYDLALRDLSSFSHIWLIWWFHKNNNWRPGVLPPRGPAQRRGVFSTRSPHRPNPIGITAVELIKIEGLKVYIGNNDLINGTPILDIKPYIKEVDSFANSNNGWLKEVDEYEMNSPKYEISFSDLAKKQLDFFNSINETFFSRASELLCKDPTPHRTRRIQKIADEMYRMSCGGWRIYFSVTDNIISVSYFDTAFKYEKLTSEGNEHIVGKDNFIQFILKFKNIS